MSTDWKQKIEAQIASLREIANDQSYCGEPGRKNTCAAAWRMDDAADSLQALLDATVAADTYLVDVQRDESEQALFDALDKLREMSDV